MPGTIVFLPTYNECDNIADIVSRVMESAPGLEALVVDDNSPDGTADVVREIGRTDARVQLILRETDRGRGRADAAAVRWFQERDYEAFIEMDADGSHNPKYIPNIIEALKRADVVICSRFMTGGGEQGRTFTRRFLTKVSNAYIRIILGLKVKDCTTGYRGFTRRAMMSLDADALMSPGPAIVQEKLFILALKGFRVEEIPFVFEPRAAGRSKLNPFTLLMSISNLAKIKRLHKTPYR
jgi:dolichol-phosphate mannosyltransferase